MKTIGFIGMGNMAQAIVRGFHRAEVINKENIFAYAPHWDKLLKNAEDVGFIPCKTTNEMIDSADLVVLACKPYQIEAVLAENKEKLKGKAVVSIAYGWTLEKAKPYLPENTRYQYIVPNTPVSVCSGILLVEEENSLSDSESRFTEALFGGIGNYMKLPTGNMGAANALAGCGPAFIAMIIEALGDAGVKHGLARQQAYSLASGVMEGTAKMQKETGLHPGVMKDQVCSPEGVTIRGVAALEEAGMRNAFFKAVDATFKKTTD